MPFLKVGVENTSDINLYYEDLGTGKPVVMVHGWPLNGASWERQTSALLASGHRVITYDRRGFGRSDKPSSGYDYDTLAADLSHLINALDLRDIALVGFSMGGGELARYMGKFDEGRVSKVVFISCITPYLRKSAENPEGVDPKAFDDMKVEIEKDRFAFLQSFGHKFFNKSLLSTTHVSDAVLQNAFNVGSQSAYHAMLFCIDAWLEDFREDCESIKVPTLVLHGEADQVLPIDATGERTIKFVPGAEYNFIPHGPHAIIWTHATEVNIQLLSFLRGDRSMPIESKEYE